MRHDPVAVRLASLQVELLRDERALVAEGQRLVLHRGQELLGLKSDPTGRQTRCATALSPTASGYLSTTVAMAVRADSVATSNFVE